MPQLKFCFCHLKVPEFRQPLNFFKQGLPKQIIEKKIVFHENGVEIRAFYGNYFKSLNLEKLLMVRGGHR